MQQTTWGMGSTVESVVKTSNNGLLIAAAAAVHIPEGATVIDVTWGRGGFWTHYEPHELIRHDLHTLDGIDFRNLPEKDESVDVAVFDPPYMPYSGTGTTLTDFHDRYGLNNTANRDQPTTTKDIEALYAEGIKECVRVLKPKGVLMVKTQDYVNSGKFQTMHHHVVNEALANGCQQIDELIHHSGIGPGAWEVQKTSRRAHSFLCIFRKNRGQ